MNTNVNLWEIVDVFDPCLSDASNIVVQQGDNGGDVHVIKSIKLSITMHMVINNGSQKISVIN